ncbi:MAG: hypothetical protein N2515_06505 [Deltaproteobacteria bacterium]|nr:hypothetical protein [Deltaproteobacteria bacterium]
MTVPPSASRPEQVRVQLETQERRRGTQGEPSEWVSMASNSLELENELRNMISLSSGAKQLIPYERMVWACAPEECKRLVLPLLAPYQPDPYEAGEGVIVTEWRESERRYDEKRLFLRSRLWIVFQGIGPNRSLAKVTAELQHRVLGPPEAEEVSEYWTDHDAAPIRAHAYAVIEAALQPYVEEAEEEQAQAFLVVAESEPPPIPSPSEMWSQLNLIPPGVEDFSTGATSTIPWFKDEGDPVALLGRILNRNLETVGQIEWVQDIQDTPYDRAADTYVSIEEFNNWSSGMGLSAFGINIGIGQREGSSQLIVIGTRYLAHHMIEAPKLGKIRGSLPDQARYYVSKVFVGKGMSIVYQSQESWWRFGGDLSAKGFFDLFSGFIASMFTQKNQKIGRSTSCRAIAKGIDASEVACQEIAWRWNEHLLEQYPSGQPAVVAVELHRLPPALKPLGHPSQLIIHSVSVNPERCNDVFGGAPDLWIEFHDGPQVTQDGEGRNCPGNTPVCDDLYYHSPPVVTIRLIDRDIIQHDHCDTETFNLLDYLPTDDTEIPVEPIHRRVKKGDITVVFEAVY